MLPGSLQHRSLGLLALCCAWLAAGMANAQSEASFAERLEHWSWQPLREGDAPMPQDAAWALEDFDRFVLSGLEQAGMQPAGDAPAEVWLRRVWFDLAGLPPPKAAVLEFLADSSAAARRRVVDDLLAAPTFGERWARHWLDLVRYAESLGHEFDFRIPEAWRYRDYVVRALNADVPYDRFALEHIAGDLLADPRVDPETGRNESVHGTAFWWFAEQTHSPVDAMQHQADRIDNQIDVLSKAFLATTVACARCHDHKFDAIRSRDYYALFGFVKSSRYVQHDVHWTPPADRKAAESAHRDLARATGLRYPAAATQNGRDGDVVLADFEQDLAEGWFRTGTGFSAEPWSGPFVEQVDGQTVRMRALQGRWALSAARGTKRNGVLHSPTFPIDRRYLHAEVAGRDARVLVVVDGLHVVRDPIYGKLRANVDSPRPYWVTVDLQMWQGQQAHVQFVDQRAHDLADPHKGTRRYGDDAWIATRRVILSDDASPPALTARGISIDYWAATDEARSALTAYLQTQQALPSAETIPGMTDGTGQDEGVFVRGNHRTRTEPVPRRFLEALGGDEFPDIPQGSGRLQLYEAMFAADNPLPARVLVNRVWHHLFGRGLVRTVDNLGHLGETPTHPELLDHLARTVAEDGWSLKRLVRRIVLSRTYGMHSVGTAEANLRDPDNLTLHRQNLRRLEGEAIRDAMLVFGDRLDATLGGPPITIHLNDNHKARGKPGDSGPLDGAGRRSLYLSVLRNFLPEFLLAFDLPTPFATVGARNVSNVPAQSLALLNDPFVTAMSERAAERLHSQQPASLEAGIENWFLTAFARLPTEDELARCTAFLTQVEACAPADAPAWWSWSQLAHALLNKKEFIFLR